MDMHCHFLSHKRTQRRAALCIALTVLLFQSQKGIGGDWGHSYPDHWLQGMRSSFSQPRWLFAAGGIAGLSRFDIDIRAAAKNKILPQPLAKLGKYYGFGANYVLGSAYIISDRLGQAKFGRQQRLEEWQLFSESYLATAATTMLIKKITRRLRPDGSSRDSFPSGHTSTSFCVAAFMNQRYGAEAGVPAGTLALITAISRLHHDRHWLSDVLAGALLGGLAGDGFARLQKSTSPTNISAHRWSMSLQVVF